MLRMQCADPHTYSSTCSLQTLPAALPLSLSLLKFPIVNTVSQCLHFVLSCHSVLCSLTLFLAIFNGFVHSSPLMVSTKKEMLRPIEMNQINEVISTLSLSLSLSLFLSLSLSLSLSLHYSFLASSSLIVMFCFSLKVKFDVFKVQ